MAGETFRFRRVFILKGAIARYFSRRHYIFVRFRQVMLSREHFRGFNGLCFHVFMFQ